MTEPKQHMQWWFEVRWSRPAGYGDGGSGARKLLRFHTRRLSTTRPVSARRVTHVHSRLVKPTKEHKTIQ